ncbi:hypothetical protein LSAT2_029949 [Lamellibrachia satsuma]|nr:hypothetical protein LSAT2_029949 [Lamellibrachia satsuma]
MFEERRKSRGSEPYGVRGDGMSFRSSRGSSRGRGSYDSGRGRGFSSYRGGRGGPSMSRGRGGGRPERTGYTADYGASSRDSYTQRETRDRDYGSNGYSRDTYSTRTFGSSLPPKRYESERSYPPASDYRAPSRGDYATSTHDYAPTPRDYGSREYAAAPREYIASRSDYLPVETRDYGPPSRMVERDYLDGPSDYAPRRHEPLARRDYSSTFSPSRSYDGGRTSQYSNGYNSSMPSRDYGGGSSSRGPHSSFRGPPSRSMSDLPSRGPTWSSPPVSSYDRRDDRPPRDSGNRRPAPPRDFGPPAKRPRDGPMSRGSPPPSRGPPVSRGPPYGGPPRGRPGGFKPRGGPPHRREETLQAIKTWMNFNCSYPHAASCQHKPAWIYLDESVKRQ